MLNVINNNDRNIDMNDNKNDNKDDIITMIKTLSLSEKKNIKNLWSNIIDIMLIFQNNVNHKDMKVEFISELEKILMMMLKHDNLCQIWYDILDENNNQMKKRGQQLLNGYKIIMNFIGISTSSLTIDTFCNGILLNNNWNIINTNTILSIINSNTKSNIVNSFCNLIAYDVMPKNCMISILRYLIYDNNNTTDFIISKLSDDWCFQSIELILRDINSICNINNDNNNNDNNKQELLSSTIFETFITKLLLKVLEGYEPKVLIDVIFLKKAYNLIIIKNIINGFPDQYVPILIYSIASLWGNKLFLSRGDIKMIDYLTESLLLVLDRIEKSILLQRNDDVSPIVPMSSYICNGISSHFESNDKNIRIKGMLVATKYSTIMGNPIVFDELKDLNDNNNNNNSNINNEISSNVDKNGESNKNIDENDSNSNSDIDDESDLESYDLEEELDTQNFVQTSYLKTCLENLQLTNEAYDKHKSALISIPNIVASNPVDLHDISGPLILELLRLTNVFNIEDFEDIRNKAILSIVNKSPIITIPIITNTFTTDNYSIGDQLLAISIVIQSAYSIADISGIPSQQSSLLPDKNNNHSSNHNNNEKTFDITKTTIKRATKLAQSKKQIVYFSNKFFGVSNLYYEPLIQLLSNFHTKMNDKNKSLLINEDCDKLTNIAIIKDLIIDTNKESKVDINSLDYLIPSKALSALGQLIKCLRNTTIQKTFAYKVIHISIQFVSSSSLEMRQSSLFSIYEAIKLLSQKTILPSKSIPTTPLGLLQNISSYDNHSNDSNDILNDPFIINIIDWCMKTANHDPDDISRTLKYEIVKIATSDV